MANVFICHHRNDFREAERLADEISKAGHLVWLEELNINQGKVITARVTEALEGDIYVVICYSQSVLATPWIGRVWMADLSRKLSAYNAKVLPVLLSGQQPSILADLKYADLVRDYSEGVSKLLHAIGYPRTPDSPPLERKDAPRIFISYAHEDEDVVFHVYDELRRQGLRPWIDKRDIGVGKDWDREIRRAMRNADFVIVFLSTNSVSKRGYVQREMRQALDLYKEIPEGQVFLMPVRLDKCEVPESLGKVQYLDYTEQGAVPKLVRSIVSEWDSRRGVRQREDEEPLS